MQGPWLGVVFMTSMVVGLVAWVWYVMKSK